MKNIKNLKYGDIVYLKTGAVGIISRILDDVFGDNESAYEIIFFNNQTSIRRSKDFIYCL